MTWPWKRYRDQRISGLVPHFESIDPIYNVTKIRISNNPIGLSSGRVGRVLQSVAISRITLFCL